MPDSSIRNVLVLLLTVALVGSVAVAGVGLGQETGDQGDAAEEEIATQSTSYLRIAHAAPGAGAVDVYVDNESAATNVPFGAVSDYMELEAGTHTVTVTVVGVRDAVVFNETVDLEAGSANTIAAAPDSEGGDEVTAVPFTDDALTPADNESAVRVTHLSSDAPAVDVVVVDGPEGVASEGAENATAEAENATEGAENATQEAANATEGAENATEGAENATQEAANATEGAENATQEAANATEGAGNATGAAQEGTGAQADSEDGETVLAENVEYTEASNYTTVPPGEYTLRVQTTEGGETVATVNVTVEAGTAYSALAIGNASEAADSPVAFSVEPVQDATTTIEIPETEEAANETETEEAANETETEEAANATETEEAANATETEEAANATEEEATEAGATEEEAGATEEEAGATEEEATEAGATEEETATATESG
ncbi:DUF4397 domain-containing protein [Halobacteriales archaeon QS_4_62_28]|nr:MAG: DUF4397 domain-containing protein [Halobacteriales archaeon QS_4_62_28]